jgi:outer membrane protein insertion porin family
MDSRLTASSHWRMPNKNQTAHINKSLYGVEVNTTVTLSIERNRVNLTFSVIEGEVAKIKEIRVAGNKVFKESTL